MKNLLRLLTILFSVYSSANPIFDERPNRSLRTYNEWLSHSLSNTRSDNSFPSATNSYEMELPGGMNFGMKIDHAFVNDETEVLFSRVIPLRGSDHYPIMLTIQ